MEMHSGNRQPRAIFRLFSGYNRDVYGLTQHILVRNAHAQALSRLLGGFSRLPAPLSGRAAIACARQPFRRRLIFPRPHSFIGLNAVHWLWAEGINTQQILKRG